MKTYFKIRAAITALICSLVLGVYFSPQLQAVKNLPGTFYIKQGQTRELPNLSENNIVIKGESIEVRASTDESIQDVNRSNVEIGGVSDGESTLTLKMFGLPIREIKVQVGESRIINPGGQSIGVTMRTQGALVVGTSEVVSADGNSRNPAKEAGIEAGDVIRSINKTEIEDADHLSEIINTIDSPDELVELGVQKNGNLRYVSVIPQADAADGKKRLGLWVRDSTAGVGTLTFYDPQTYMFGALGHAITDIDTRQKLNVRNGEILNSQVIDIKQGTKGEPGEIKGNFNSNNAIGSISKNTEYGLFGKGYEPIANPLYPQGIQVAAQEEVTTGKASILTTIDAAGVQEFECEIVRLQSQSAPTQRGMVVAITDQRLLDTTGGIVQGMSGSPLLQNGKIVGAVTHVFVNDPTKGYAMFIEWMLGESEI